jgi:hypothetical protein
MTCFSLKYYSIKNHILREKNFYQCLMVGILYVALFLHMAEREREVGWGGGVATTMPAEQIALYRPFSPLV